MSNGAPLEPPSRPRVLLAGDASARPSGLERALTRAGFQVTEAPGPASEAPPDALLITLAEADGPHLDSLFASGDPSPPRLVVFGLENRDAPGAALAAGADDALAAPVHFAELCARIHARIRDRQAPRQTPYEQGVRGALQALVTQARAVLRPDEIVLALVRRLARAFGLAHCSYVVIAEGEDQGRIVADAGEPREAPDRLDLGRYPEIAEAARTRRPVTLPDLHAAPAWATTASLVVLPVPGEGDVPGVLLLHPRESQPWLNSVQLDLAGSVARAAAEALALDSLPGAMVPMTLDRRLQEEFERARRYSLSFSLVLLEMDPPGGTPAPPAAEAAEALLQEVGSRLRRELRLPDFVSHYGKGELAIVLPETGRDGARRSVSRIRERLATSHSTDLRPFSAGIVTYPHPAVSHADDLFALVEAALMRGKGQVGDRVGVAE